MGNLVQITLRGKMERDFNEFKEENCYLTNTALIRDMIREYLKNNKE